MATLNVRIYFKLDFFKQQNGSFSFGKENCCPNMNNEMMEVYPTDIYEAFYDIVSALSVHQLAAQGEMLYLATRIEQGNNLF